MRLNLESVKDLFNLLRGESGNATEHLELLCEPLCASGIRAIENQINRQNDVAVLGNYRMELEFAAAATALYDLALIEESQMPKSISSTELKMEYRDKSKQAKALLEEKLAAVSPVMKQKSFYFGSVAT